MAYFWRRCCDITKPSLTESGRGRHSIAEKADGLNGTIVPFVTSDNSRRDNETCWLLEARSLTNQLDSVILSPKTKCSVITQKSRIGRVVLVV